APQPAPAAGCAGTPVARGGARPSRARMTFKEQRELDALPDEIEALEREQHELSGRMCAPDYHRQGVEQLKADRHRAEEIEVMLRERFERWGALDAKAQAPRTTR
ncbi:MAG: ABC transporter ATP-binding protein, partial [Betaproteobacteria bacterium]|nr:ABC transporter ATP-binding protein [Betaproteobacteria bacterium]